MKQAVTPGSSFSLLIVPLRVEEKNHRKRERKKKAKENTKGISVFFFLSLRKYYKRAGSFSLVIVCVNLFLF